MLKIDTGYKAAHEAIEFGDFEIAIEHPLFTFSHDVTQEDFDQLPLHIVDSFDRVDTLVECIALPVGLSCFRRDQNNEVRQQVFDHMSRGFEVGVQAANKILGVPA